VKFDDVIATLASDQVIRLASKDVMHRLREVLGDSRTSWAMRAASSSRSVRSSRRKCSPRLASHGAKEFPPALNLLRQHGVVQYSSCGRLIVDVSALKN